MSVQTLTILPASQTSHELLLNHTYVTLLRLPASLGGLVCQVTGFAALEEFWRGFLVDDHHHGLHLTAALKSTHLPETVGVFFFIIIILCSYMNMN